MNLEIRKVGPDTIEELHNILEECGQDMQVRFGLAHWVPAYPLHLMQRDAEVKSVFAVRAGDRAMATFTIGTQVPSYYDMTIWENPGAKALYVSRLAVLPALQGRGIGKWCMDTIERLAVAEDCTAVRLDAYDKHVELHEFYRRLGYRQRGVFRFNTKLYGETGAVFFEKIV
jgi:GNAT superfamily N-acetyltransferase